MKTTWVIVLALAFSVGTLRAEVEVGTSLDTLEKEWGEPVSRIVFGSKKELVYPNKVRVYLENDKVTGFSNKDRFVPTGVPKAPAPAATPNPVAAPAVPPVPVLPPGVAPARPRRTIDPGKQLDNMRINAFCSDLVAFYRYLNEGTEERVMTFTRNDKSVEITGIPPNVLKSGETRLLVEIEKEFTPPKAPAGGTVMTNNTHYLVMDARTKKTEAFPRKATVYNGKTEEQMAYISATQADTGTQLFLSRCRTLHAVLARSSTSPATMEFKRTGKQLVVTGIPKEFLGTGETSVSLDYGSSPAKANGMDYDEWSANQFWYLPQ